MANIRINGLPNEASPTGSDVVPIDGLTTRKTTLTALVNAGGPLANQAEAEAGSNNSKRMTPLTTAQAIAAQGGVQFASTAQGALADSALQPSDIGASVGNMSKSAYDPTNKNADAFSMANMIEGVTNKIFSAAERTKLSGIASGATANSTDATLLNRTNHTGTQAVSTVTGLQTALDGKLAASSNLNDLPNKATARQVLGFFDQNIRWLGADPGAGDNTSEVSSANSLGGVWHVPAGTYNTTLGHYDLASARFTGDGRLTMGGFNQARDRSFLVSDPGDVTSESRLQIFNNIPNAMQEASYSFVGAAVGSTPGAVYRNLNLAAKKLSVFDFNGGHNTSVSDHAAGRTGGFHYVDRIYHGGQGDLVNQTFHGEVYSARSGATHFLANPAVIHSNGGFEANSGATGALLNHSEFIYQDNGLAIAVIDRVRNYFRSNAGSALSQVWIHDRAQTGGTQPIDAFFAPSGKSRRGLDFTPSDFGAERAAIVLKEGDRIYGASSAVGDPLGIKWCASVLGSPFINYDTGWNFVVANNVPSLKLRANAAAVNYIDIEGRETGVGPIIQATGANASVGMWFASKGSGFFGFRTQGFGPIQFYVAHTDNAVNYVEATGGATNTPAILRAAGADADISIVASAKGSGSFQVRSNGVLALVAGAPASGANWVQVTGSLTGINPNVTAAGADANLSILFRGKGTGGGEFQDGAFGVKFRYNQTGVAWFGNSPVARPTYGAPTGTATRTTFDTATVTLPQLAERLKALIDDVRSYGLAA